MIELTEIGKWIEVCKINKGAKFHYLSYSPFMIKVKKYSRKLRPALTSSNWIQFNSNDMAGNNSPIWLSKINKNSFIYFWIIQNG